MWQDAAFSPALSASIVRNNGDKRDDGCGAVNLPPVCRRILRAMSVARGDDLPSRIEPSAYPRIPFSGEWVRAFLRIFALPPLIVACILPLSIDSSQQGVELLRKKLRALVSIIYQHMFLPSNCASSDVSLFPGNLNLVPFPFYH